MGSWNSSVPSDWLKSVPVRLFRASSSEKIQILSRSHLKKKSFRWDGDSSEFFQMGPLAARPSPVWPLLLLLHPLQWDNSMFAVLRHVQGYVLIREGDEFRLLDGVLDAFWSRREPSHSLMPIYLSKYKTKACYSNRKVVEIAFIYRMKEIWRQTDQFCWSYGWVCVRRRRTDAKWVRVESAGYSKKKSIWKKSDHFDWLPSNPVRHIYDYSTSISEKTQKIMLTIV